MRLAWPGRKLIYCTSRRRSPADGKSISRPPSRGTGHHVDVEQHPSVKPGRLRCTSITSIKHASSLAILHDEAFDRPPLWSSCWACRRWCARRCRGLPPRVSPSKLLKCGAKVTEGDRSAYLAAEGKSSDCRQSRCAIQYEAYVTRHQEIDTATPSARSQPLSTRRRRYHT